MPPSVTNEATSRTWGPFERMGESRGRETRRRSQTSRVGVQRPGAVDVDHVADRRQLDCVGRRLGPPESFSTLDRSPDQGSVGGAAGLLPRPHRHDCENSNAGRFETLR